MLGLDSSQRIKLSCAICAGGEEFLTNKMHSSWNLWPHGTASPIEARSEDSRHMIHISSSSGFINELRSGGTGDTSAMLSPMPEWFSLRSGSRPIFGLSGMVISGEMDAGRASTKTWSLPAMPVLSCWEDMLGVEYFQLAGEILVL